MAQTAGQIPTQLDILRLGRGARRLGRCARRLRRPRARRPSRRFLDITVHCCCPAQLPCITHNSPAWRGQLVARPHHAEAAITSHFVSTVPRATAVDEAKLQEVI